MTLFLTPPNPGHPLWRIISAMFAKGQFDLTAGRPLILAHVQHLANGPGEHLATFFTQLNLFGSPELNQWLLHQCLYSSTLTSLRQRCFPTCVPFYRCKDNRQWHLFLPLLQGAFVQPPRFSPNLGPDFASAIETFVTTHNPAVSDQYQDVIPPHRAKDIYGRTILFAPEPGTQRVFRLKLAKKGENRQDFFRELPALNFLSKHQANGQLPLTSKLPVAVDMFCLPDFASWLAQSSLSSKQQALLREQVHTDHNGSALAYLYYTESPEEPYEHYVYEHQLPGYGLENARTTLAIAATDMGILWRRGICFDNAIALYHNNDSDPRCSLWRLSGLPPYSTCGCITDWNGATTDYPNIAPQLSILRDFGDIHSFAEVLSKNSDPDTGKSGAITMDTIARMLLALELLLARTLATAIQEAAQDPHGQKAQDTAVQIESSLKEIYRNFAQQAFGAEVAEQFVTWITTRPSPKKPTIVAQAAREILYFTETGDHPRFAQDLLAGRVGHPYPSESTPPPRPRNFTPQGKKLCSTDRGVALTDTKRPFSLVQCVHMKYLLLMLAAALELVNIDTPAAS